MTGKELSAALETVIRVVERDPGGGNEHTVWFTTDGKKRLLEESPIWLVTADELLADLENWKREALKNIRELRKNMYPDRPDQKLPDDVQTYYLTSVGATALVRLEQLLNHE